MKRQMAEICVKAVMAVADLDRKDVNMDLIKVSKAIYLTFGFAKHLLLFVVVVVVLTSQGVHITQPRISK